MTFRTIGGLGADKAVFLSLVNRYLDTGKTFIDTVGAYTTAFRDPLRGSAWPVKLVKAYETTLRCIPSGLLIQSVPPLFLFAGCGA
jgi:hypothetical protein